MLFHERGLKSGHFYQPRANCRDLDVGNLTSGRNDDGEGSVTSPPILESLLAPGDSSEFFDKTAPISFFLHQIEDTTLDLESNDETVLTESYYSHMGLYVPKLDQSWSNEKTFLRGVIRNRRAVQLSAIGFKRTLELLGYVWTSEDGTPKDDNDCVTLGDQAALLYLFGMIDISTKDNFKRFLIDFDFNGIYSFQDGVPFNIQLHQFGQLLRSLTSFRSSVPDGQHRSVMIGLQITGFHTMSNEYLLEQIPSDDVFPESQIWREMKIRLYSPVDKKCKVADTIDMLKLLFGQFSIAQVTKIPLVLTDIIASLLPELRIECEQSAVYQNCTFENFLQTSLVREDKGQHIENLREIFNIVEKVLKKRPMFLTYLMQRKDFKQVQSVMRKGFMQYWIPIINPKRYFTKQGTPIPYSCFLEIVRCAFHRSSAFGDLVLMFVPPRNGFPQRSDATRHYSTFHSESFLKKEILSIYYRIFKCYEKKVKSEVKKISLVRKLIANNQAIREEIERQQAEGRKVISVQFLENIQDKTQQEADRRTPKVVKKLIAIAAAEILTDMARTINSYGYDPDIVNREGPLHKCLRRYLR